MNILVTLTASQELLDVLQKIAGGLNPAQKSEAAVVNMPKDKGKKAPASTTETTSTQATDQKSEITLEMVREKVAAAAAADKKSEIKALLAEFGVDKVPSLKPEQYPSFLEKLQKVAA